MKKRNKIDTNINSSTDFDYSKLTEKEIKKYNKFTKLCTIEPIGKAKYVHIQPRIKDINDMDKKITISKRDLFYILDCVESAKYNIENCWKTKDLADSYDQGFVLGRLDSIKYDIEELLKK